MAIGALKSNDIQHGIADMQRATVGRMSVKQHRTVRVALAEGEYSFIPYQVFSSLDNPTKELSMGIFRQCIRDESLWAKHRKALMFASVAVACRENEFPLGVRDIAAKAKEHGVTMRLMFGYTKMVSRIRNVKIIPADPLIFLRETAREFSIGSETVTAAEKTLRELKARRFNCAVPKVACLVALYLSGHELTMEQVLSTSGRGKRSLLRNKISEAEQGLVGYSPRNAAILRN